jgi:hypothetical protein
VTPGPNPQDPNPQDGHTLPRKPRTTTEAPTTADTAITGEPTPQEEKAVARALELLAAEDRSATSTSTWKMAGRAWATRSGILDYRTRLGRDSWPVAERLPWAGRAYEGRHGRGDSK